jgi:hypothetical protein
MTDHERGNRRVDDANADAAILLDLEYDRDDSWLGGARDVAGSGVVTLARCCVLLAHTVGHRAYLPRDQVGTNRFRWA